MNPYSSVLKGKILQRSHSSVDARLVESPFTTASVYYIRLDKIVLKTIDKKKLHEKHMVIQIFIIFLPKKTKKAIKKSPVYKD